MEGGVIEVGVLCGGIESRSHREDDIWSRDLREVREGFKRTSWDRVFQIEE